MRIRGVTRDKRARGRERRWDAADTQKYLQAWRDIDARDIDAFNLKRYRSGGWIPPARLSYLAAPEPGTDTEEDERSGTRPGRKKVDGGKVAGGRIAEYGGRRPRRP